jgi:hypothetical protein
MSRAASDGEELICFELASGVATHRSCAPEQEIAQHGNAAIEMT